MTRKHAFHPSVLAGGSQLEARVVLSHQAAHHLLLPLARAGVHHHPVAAHVIKAHGKAAHHGSRAPTGTGPTSQSKPRPPIVVLPISSLPVAPPAASPPDSGSPGGTTTLPIPTVSGVMSAQEQSIVDLVNQQRQQAGLAPLEVSSQLIKEAQIHSNDMAALGDMEHTLPGAALPALEDRAKYVGYNYSYLGENIAFNYPDANSVMDAWMNSPGHRANILDPNYTQIGVGISHDSQGELYYTQEFGKPA